MSQAAANSNHKGRHVVSARALRFLFASGILGGHGKGKHREVGYNRKRAGQVKTMRARGLDVTSRKGFRRSGQGASRPGKPFSSFGKANAAAGRNKGFGRAVIGGGAAGLRGSGGGKVDAIRADLRSPSLGHNGTSLRNGFQLIAKKHGVDVKTVQQQAQHLAKTEKRFGSSKGGQFASGVTHGGQDIASRSRHHRQQRLRTRLEAEGKTNADSKAMRNLTRAERIAASRQQAQKFFATPKGQKVFQQRREAGSADAFKAQRRTEAAARREKKPVLATSPKVDHSATRAARIAAGKQMAKEQVERLRTVTQGSRRSSVSHLSGHLHNPRFTAQVLTDNKFDVLPVKRLKKIYQSAAAASRTTTARAVLKRHWVKRS